MLEVQSFQIGEIAQLRGDGARQSVVTEEQPLQIGEIAQLCGQLARQSLVLEGQPCHMRAGDADALPLTDET